MLCLICEQAIKEDDDYLYFDHEPDVQMGKFIDGQLVMLHKGDAYHNWVHNCGRKK